METGKITRKKRDSGFTIIPNGFLKSEKLSWKAKGLLTYLLSLPDDWSIYKSELVKRAKDGYDSMLTGWNELESLGYIEATEIRKSGLFGGYEYIVHESPIRDFPESVFPESENPQLISTNSNNTNSNIIDDLSSIILLLVLLLLVIL